MSVSIRSTYLYSLSFGLLTLKTYQKSRTRELIFPLPSLYSLPYLPYVCSTSHMYPSSAATMQKRRDAAGSKGAGSSQGGTSSALTESGKNPVRIPLTAVDEREKQAIKPDVSFHTIMQDMQQRMDSMATAIRTLNVELKNSRQASQYLSSWTQAKKSSSSRSKAVKEKKKKQTKRIDNTTSDDDDDDDDDESTGSSTGTDATQMPIIDNSTLRTIYLADGSAMLPVATSDPRLTDQVYYRRYRLRKRKVMLRSEKAKGLKRRAREINQRVPSNYFDGSERLAVLTFLRHLKVVFDESGNTEAMGSRLLFDFVRGKASPMLESSRASVYRTINSYHGIIQHLLKVYATESAMMRAQATFYQMMQHTGEDVLVFASRLQEQAGLLGTLYTAEELKGKFVQGLAPGVGGFLPAVGPSHKDEIFNGSSFADS
jgi:hypothetical protein